MKSIKPAGYKIPCRFCGRSATMVVDCVGHDDMGVILVPKKMRICDDCYGPYMEGVFISRFMELESMPISALKTVVSRMYSQEYLDQLMIDHFSKRMDHLKAELPWLSFRTYLSWIIGVTGKFAEITGMSMKDTIDLFNNKGIYDWLDDNVHILAIKLDSFNVWEICQDFELEECFKNGWPNRPDYDLFELADFESEDLEYFMEKYSETFKRLRG